MPAKLGPVERCPECGKFPLLVETTFIKSGGSIGAVGCYDCKMLATGETTQHAILLWNALDDDLEDGH